jgi:sulfatase modifying factor 1
MKKIVFTLVIMVLLAGFVQATEPARVLASAEYLPLTAEPQQVDTFTDPKSGMEFVHVKGGCFCMGGPAGEGARNAAAVPVRTVCVDDYYIGKYEVTRAQWRAVMGVNPASENSCGDNCPVVGVNWNEVQEFVKRLSESTGKTFRLPTEAEWEYAAKTGGSSASARTAAGSRPALRPVGLAQPNRLGIYDMLGSVWEWTSDRYSAAAARPGSYVVLRGGSWIDKAAVSQPTFRIKYKPWIQREWVGFRVSSPDTSTAKLRIPDMLSVEKEPGQDGQCGPVQSASAM